MSDEQGGPADSVIERMEANVAGMAGQLLAAGIPTYRVSSIASRLGELVGQSLLAGSTIPATLGWLLAERHTAENGAGHTEAEIEAER